MQKPHTFHYARIIDKNVQMILFPESKTHIFIRLSKQTQQTKTYGRNS
jgi:hypothetical protein